MQIGEGAFCSSLEEEQLEKPPLNAPQVNHLLVVADHRELWLLFKHYSKFVEKFMFQRPELMGSLLKHKESGSLILFMYTKPECHRWGSAHTYVVARR